MLTRHPFLAAGLLCLELMLSWPVWAQTLDALLAEGRAGSFDFAFIDADKENYGGYYDRCLQLVRAGGVIAIDNVLWDGKVADPGVTDVDTAAIRVLNARIHGDDRVLATLLPVGDGLTLAMKK